MIFGRPHRPIVYRCNRCDPDDAQRAATAWPCCLTAHVCSIGQRFVLVSKAISGVLLSATRFHMQESLTTSTGIQGSGAKPSSASHRGRVCRTQAFPLPRGALGALASRVPAVRRPILLAGSALSSQQDSWVQCSHPSYVQSEVPHRTVLSRSAAKCAPAQPDVCKAGLCPLPGISDPLTCHPA